MARESARMQRAAERQKAREIRAEIADRRRRVASEQAAARTMRSAYLQSRAEETAALNAELKQRMTELVGILEHTLSVDDAIVFSELQIHDEFESWDKREGTSTPRPERGEFIGGVTRPRGLRALVPGVMRKYREHLDGCERAYEKACAAWDNDRAERRSAFELKKTQRNAEVDALRDSYEAGDSEAIVDYTALVLERSTYPDGFPQVFRLAFGAESKQLVVEYQLPPMAVVPSEAEYRFVKTKNQITSKPRKPQERGDIYQDVVAGTALRTIHEVFEADRSNHVHVVCFNGYVDTVDAATGRDVRSCLVSVRATRETFADIDLSRVEKRACLRHLGAQVSPRPAEAEPIKPVVDINMVDPRFIDQTNVLAELDARPNLLEMDPFQFEHLVANLFSEMGLTTKLTQSSRDGGVDCVAFDPRPVLGGKVVIQAKRYSKTVGVSAVRDLYGTMLNEGANKGILVTTSGYGPDAFAFSRGKPIELIDGGGLLYLLQQVGKEARIVLPEA